MLVITEDRGSKLFYIENIPPHDCQYNLQVVSKMCFFTFAKQVSRVYIKVVV